MYKETYLENELDLKPVLYWETIKNYLEHF